MKKKQNFNKFPSWSVDPPKRLTAKNIRIFIFQCADIPAADKDGTSDCFISVWNPDNLQTKRTGVVEDTCNPIFFESLEISYDMKRKGKTETN